ncbi:MAG: ammonia-forming cytochrome c nitrite reductase subunit c552 [Clostridia bacterium]|nr:ammonia-forming cytochrome c nitrite reductase subunit c552 [Clostridia bacterium]
MNEFKRKQWSRIGLSLIAVVLAVLFLTGIIGGKAMTYQVKEPLTPMMQGITVTMGQNAENSEAEDYLELDPYLVNIYEGYGFAKDYKAARGHAYTLEDLSKTARPHDQAKCITCKTPDFTKMVNEEGVGVYTRPFDEVMSQMTQAISCYTCHGDDKGNNGQIVITHSYVQEAMGENAKDIDPKVLNCGQCHIEYYFTPENQETMMPYSGKDEMTPEAILAYYDELGFKDWEQPGTGTPMLKAQHPEMETYLFSTHSAMGLNCASCHMAEETAEDGSTYHSHYLISPLQSETLMETCAACHGSADAARTLVTSTQERVTSRETEVGNRLSGLKDELTAAVAEGRLTEEELATVRQLHREAQWFFDFCYVENSEGAHNSKLSMRCLDTADDKITEAMALLTGEVPEAPAEEEEQTETDGKLAGAVVQGFGGEVTINLGLNPDRTVQTLFIDTPNETPGLGQRASEEAFTSQFIGKTGPFTYGEDGIEALSGATVTSNVVLQAINELIAGAEPPAEPDAEEGKEDTALLFTDQGFGGEVTVHLELNEDQTVKSLAIDTPNETAGLGQRASEEAFTSQFVGKTGPFTYGENGIDALAGATVTSEAVLKAVNQAFDSDQAGKETAEEKPAEAASHEEAPEALAEETPVKAEEKEVSSGLVYGSYMAEKETNFSVIRVTVSTKNDEITDCKITSEAKSEGSDFLTDEIRKTWAKAIVENQSAETDAITGATLQFSAGAVKEAVADIRLQMAGEEAEEAPAEETEPAVTAGDSEEKAPEKTEGKPASSGVVYGSYLSEKETNFSTVRVTVSTKNGEITSCRITSEGKSEGSDFLTDEIRAEWAKAIVENQSAETDIITGATLQFSAGAVQEAVNEILQKISGR